MIQWNNYFDKIWCINYLPYKERRKSLEKEIHRIGISNDLIEWNQTISSPWHDFLFYCTKQLNKSELINTTVLKCTLAHYYCLKRSQIYNNKFIMIIEDDSRFLKDISKIQDILNNIPNNSDILMLDWFVNTSKDEFNKYINNKINEYFYRFNSLYSTGCYALSNKAINYLVKQYETFLYPSDHYLTLADGKILNKYFSIKNISCQVTYNKSMSFHNGGNMTIHNVYKKVNLNYDDYMMRDDGSKYDYGDFIIEND